MTDTETPPEEQEAAPKKKSDLGPRLVTAVVAIPILIAIIFPAPAWAFYLLTAAAGAISAWEYCGICLGKENQGAKGLTAALSFGITTVMYFFQAHIPEAVIGSSMILMLYFLFAYKDQAKVTAQLGACITALIYAGLMFGCLALLHRDAGAAGPYWVIVVLGVIWLSDTGAYFAGRAFGKNKLYEAVSPNKTREGAFGGLLGSIAAGFLFNYLFSTLDPESWKSLEIWQIFAVAVPANFLGQTGDLIESLVKRAHGVKDSGTIIYGHGGMLDRIDALIFASPWFYYCYLRILT